MLLLKVGGSGAKRCNAKSGGETVQPAGRCCLFLLIYFSDSSGVFAMPLELSKLAHPSSGNIEILTFKPFTANDKDQPRLARSKRRDGRRRDPLVRWQAAYKVEAYL